MQGHRLSIITAVLAAAAWTIVLSPIAVLILWGARLIILLNHDTIGLAVILAGTALLLAFYAIMLWWRTQWQSSRAVAILLLLAVSLLCAYELSAVYVTAGRSASNQFSPSAFFFGVSAIAMGINMLFICKMVFNGAGLDVDEYVRRSYKFAHAETLEVGPIACLPEPPEPRDASIQRKSSTWRLAQLYQASVVVLAAYSVLYGLTAREARWLGGVTSAAVIILDMNIGACLFGFKLLKSRIAALLVAGSYRMILICFGVHFWYLGHCVGYSVVASVLLGAVVVRHVSVVNPEAARRAALKNTVIRLREGFGRRGPGSSSSVSEGRTSSVVHSSVGAEQIGAAIELISRANARPQGETLGAGFVGHNGGTGLTDAFTAGFGLQSVDSHVSTERVGSSQQPSSPDHDTTDSNRISCAGSVAAIEPLNAVERSSTFASLTDQQTLDLNLALMFQERMNDPRITSILRQNPEFARGGEHELMTLLQDKGLDPNFATMLKEKGLDPTILALLQRSSIDAGRDPGGNENSTAGLKQSQSLAPDDAVGWTGESHKHACGNWFKSVEDVVQFFVGTPERAWVFFSVIFVVECVIVAVFRPTTVTVINGRHEQFEFGFSALLLSPVTCSLLAFLRSLQAENMALTKKVRKFGLIAWLLSTGVGLLLAFLSKSSIILGLAVTVPLMLAALSVALPIWVHNGYNFYQAPVLEYHATRAWEQQARRGRTKEDNVMTLCILVTVICIIALGVIISFSPLDDIKYHSWSSVTRYSTSPYTSPLYLGWAIASAFALVITGVLPAISWFATYRFSLSSAVCVAIFTVVLMTFCGGSYVGIVRSRIGKTPTEADFLAALLPLVCIPAVFSLGCGLYKWRDEGWRFSKGAYVFVGLGLTLLLGAISAVIATINPWMVGAAFLLVLVLVVLTIAVIHHWASHNFYLTRMEVLFVCLAALVLALAAFLIGLLADEPFVGASVGYFAFLGVLAGRSFTVLLSPAVVVYSPRVLPVYVYDAHADSAKNVSGAFLVLYGIALATAGWGVVASLEIYPPFAGSAVSAITLVVAYAFAISRPQLTLKMMEDALQFLRKETIAQAIARSSTKTRNAMSGTCSAPQRSASSAALLVGDASVTRDKAGNYVLPRADVLKLREWLRNEEHAAGLRWWPPFSAFGSPFDSTTDTRFRRKLCAHARILALEEAIDTEWVYMWDKFGGYLLLVLGHATRAERVQDEVRLRLFLDSIGFSNLSAKKIKTWTPEDRKQFETVQENYMREKETEEELLQQRREEEGKGRERRRALLEKEERRRHEIEASVISTVPDAGTKEAAAMAAAVRAVGRDILLDENSASDQVSSLARRILVAQRAQRAQQTGVHGTVCVMDNEPRNSGRCCGLIDPSVCGSQKVSFSAAVMIQPDSGPVCILGVEAHNKKCLEFLVAGAEQGLEAGQVGLRLVSKGAGQSTHNREWFIGHTCVADGRWHSVTITVDASTGEASAFIDGGFDGDNRCDLLLLGEGGVWEEGMEVWVGIRPPMDLDAFGRSDSEGAESKMHAMDVFMWGRCLTEDEILMVHNCANLEEQNELDIMDDYWQGSPMETPMRFEDWRYDPDLSYERDEIFWDEQQSSGAKRKAADIENVAVDIEYLSRKIRRPKIETKEEVLQRMQAVELAIKEALVARGEKRFTDQEFPPSDQSLFVDTDHPAAKLQVVNKWSRPEEVLREQGQDSRPCLFAGTANPSDVCQGHLGDCWFLSAVAVLTEASRISDVMITPEFNEEGIYTVRFCIQGEWVPVVVDDWIPCEARGKPAFATSRKGNELWVSILEKAYAKLHGSYEALEGGQVHDALVDLTGGAGEEIDLTNEVAQLDLASGHLWSQLQRFKQEGFLLGAGSPSGSDVHVSSSGIVQNHAYSLLQVREVDGHKLVQIRNPWANEVEWNGPWSDFSPEWTDRMKHKLKYSPQAANGVFWMSWQDFQLHFRSLYVCRIYPPEMKYSVRGQWRGPTAGGCQDYETWHLNPQFHLKAVGSDAREPIHVFATLTQGVQSTSRSTASFGNYQLVGDAPRFYIGMRVIKTGGRRSGKNIFMHEAVNGTDYVNAREISCEMVLDPDPKGYTIVPTTHAPGEECQFLLSVFTKASIILEPL